MWPEDLAHDQQSELPAEDPVAAGDHNDEDVEEDDIEQQFDVQHNLIEYLKNVVGSHHSSKQRRDSHDNNEARADNRDAACTQSVSTDRSTVAASGGDSGGAASQCRRQQERGGGSLQVMMQQLRSHLQDQDQDHEYSDESSGRSALDSDSDVVEEDDEDVVNVSNSQETENIESSETVRSDPVTSDLSGDLERGHTDDLTRLTEALRLAEVKCQRLTSTNADLQLQLLQAQSKVNSESVRGDELQSRLDDTLQQLLVAEKRVVSVQAVKKRQLDELRQQNTQHCDQLKQELEQCRQEAGELEQQQLVVSEQNVCLEKRVEELNSSLTVKDELIAKLQQQLRETELEKEASVERLTGQLVQWSSQVDDLDQQLTVARRQADEATAAQVALQSSLNAETRRAEDADSRLAEVRDMLTRRMSGEEHRQHQDEERVRMSEAVRRDLEQELHTSEQLIGDLKVKCRQLEELAAAEKNGRSELISELQEAREKCAVLNRTCDEAVGEKQRLQLVVDQLRVASEQKLASNIRSDIAAVDQERSAPALEAQNKEHVDNIQDIVKRPISVGLDDCEGAEEITRLKLECCRLEETIQERDLDRENLRQEVVILKGQYKQISESLEGEKAEKAAINAELLKVRKRCEELEKLTEADNSTDEYKKLVKKLKTKLKQTLLSKSELQEVVESLRHEAAENSSRIEELKKSAVVYSERPTDESLRDEATRSRQLVVSAEKELQQMRQEVERMRTEMNRLTDEDHSTAQLSATHGHVLSQIETLSAQLCQDDADVHLLLEQLDHVDAEVRSLTSTDSEGVHSGYRLLQPYSRLQSRLMRVLRQGSRRSSVSEWSHEPACHTDSAMRRAPHGGSQNSVTSERSDPPTEDGDKDSLLQRHRAKLRQAMAALKRRTEQRDDAEKQAAQLRDQVSEASASIESLHKQLSDVTAQLQEATRQLAELDQRSEEYRNTIDCLSQQLHLTSADAEQPEQQKTELDRGGDQDVKLEVCVEGDGGELETNVRHLMSQLRRLTPVEAGCLFTMPPAAGTAEVVSLPSTASGGASETWEVLEDATAHSPDHQHVAVHEDDTTAAQRVSDQQERDSPSHPSASEAVMSVNNEGQWSWRASPTCSTDEHDSHSTAQQPSQPSQCHQLADSSSARVVDEWCWDGEGDGDDEHQLDTDQTAVPSSRSAQQHARASSNRNSGDCGDVPVTSSSPSSTPDEQHEETVLSPSVEQVVQEPACDQWGWEEDSGWPSVHQAPSEALRLVDGSVVANEQFGVVSESAGPVTATTSDQCGEADVSPDPDVVSESSEAAVVRHLTEQLSQVRCHLELAENERARLSRQLEQSAVAEQHLASLHQQLRDAEQRAMESESALTSTQLEKVTLGQQLEEFTQNVASLTTQRDTVVGNHEQLSREAEEAAVRASEMQAGLNQYRDEVQKLQQSLASVNAQLLDKQQDDSGARLSEALCQLEHERCHAADQLQQAASRAADLEHQLTSTVTANQQLQVSADQLAAQLHERSQHLELTEHELQQLRVLLQTQVEELRDTLASTRSQLAETADKLAVVDSERATLLQEAVVTARESQQREQQLTDAVGQLQQSGADTERLMDKMMMQLRSAAEHAELLEQQVRDHTDRGVQDSCGACEGAEDLTLTATNVTLSAAPHCDSTVSPSEPMIPTEGGFFDPAYSAPPASHSCSTDIAVSSPPLFSLFAAEDGETDPFSVVSHSAPGVTPVVKAEQSEAVDGRSQTAGAEVDALVDQRDRLAAELVSVQRELDQEREFKRQMEEQLERDSNVKHQLNLQILESESNVERLELRLAEAEQQILALQHQQAVEGNSLTDLQAKLQDSQNRLQLTESELLQRQQCVETQNSQLQALISKRDQLLLDLDGCRTELDLLRSQAVVVSDNVQRSETPVCEQLPTASQWFAACDDSSPFVPTTQSSRGHMDPGQFLLKPSCDQDVWSPSQQSNVCDESRAVDQGFTSSAVLQDSSTETESRRLQEEIDELNSRISQLDARLKEKDQEIYLQKEEIDQQKEQFARDKEQALFERDEAVLQCNEFMQQRDELYRQRECAVQETQQVIVQKDELVGQVERLSHETDMMTRERDQLIQQRDAITSQANELIHKCSHLTETNSALSVQLTSLQDRVALFDSVNQQLSEARAECDQLRARASVSDLGETSTRQHEDKSECLLNQVEQLQEQLNATTTDLNTTREQLHQYASWCQYYAALCSSNDQQQTAAASTSAAAVEEVTESAPTGDDVQPSIDQDNALQDGRENPITTSSVDTRQPGDIFRSLASGSSAVDVATEQPANSTLTETSVTSAAHGVIPSVFSFFRSATSRSSPPPPSSSPSSDAALLEQLRCEVAALTADRDCLRQRLDKLEGSVEDHDPLTSATGVGEGPFLQEAASPLSPRASAMWQEFEPTLQAVAAPSGSVVSDANYQPDEAASESHVLTTQSVSETPLFEEVPVDNTTVQDQTVQLQALTKQLHAESCKCGQLQTEVSSLQEEVGALRENIVTLQHDHDQQAQADVAENTRLKEQVEALKQSALKDLVDAGSSGPEVSADGSVACCDHQRSLDDLQSRLADETLRCCQLSCDLDSARQDNEQLLEQMNMCRHQLTQLQQQQQQVSRDDSGADEQSEERAQVEFLRGKVVELENELSGVTAELQASKLRCGRLVHKVKTLQKQPTTAGDSLDATLLDELRAQNEEWQRRAQQADSYSRQLQQEKTRLADQLSTFQQAHDRLVESKELLDAEVARLHAENGQLRANLTDMQWKLAELQETLSAGDSQTSAELLDQLLNDKQRLQQRLGELETDNERLLKRYQELTDPTTSTTAVTADLGSDEDNSKLHSAVEALQLALDASQTENATLAERLRHYDEYVSSLQQHHGIKRQEDAASMTIDVHEAQFVSAVQADSIDSYHRLHERQGNSPGVHETAEDSSGPGTDTLGSSSLLQSREAIIHGMADDLQAQCATNAALTAEMAHWRSLAEHGENGDVVRRLSQQTRQLYDSLQHRETRCQELTSEVAQLLEERDLLQLRLSSALRFQQQQKDLSAADFSQEQHSHQQHPDVTELQMKLAELKKLNYMLDIQLQDEITQRRRLQRSLQSSSELLQRGHVSLSPNMSELVEASSSVV